MATAIYIAFILAIADFVAVYVLIDTPFSSTATAIHFFLVSLGCIGTLASFALAILSGAALLCRERIPLWVICLLAGAVLGGATLHLNARFIHTQNLVLTLLVAASAVLGAALTWLSLKPNLKGRTGTLAVAGCLVLAVALYLVDASQLRGLYFLQHVTLGIYTWLLLGTGAGLLLARWLPLFASERLLKVAILGDGLICAMAAIVFWATPGDAVSQNLRYVLFSGSTASREALHLVSAATDWDRDGFSSILGQGDCAPFDAEIHPLAKDLPDDGVDQNCLAGDVSGEALERFKSMQGRSARPDGKKVDNVVLISVDALRYDRVDGENAHPIFARLVKRGISFERAYCLYPGTVPSLWGLVTSSYPSAQQLTPHENLELPVHDEKTTLFHVLADEGIDSHGVLYYRYMTPEFGMTKGMKQVLVGADMKRGISSSETTAMGVEFLADREAPFFLWLHYFDPHAPYVVEPGHPKEGAGDAQRYEVELDRAARAVDAFVRELDRSGLMSRTAVIFTADHGEEFGDHGRSFHGQTLYDETTRVPLVFLLPGEPPRRVPAPVSHIDLAPTVVGLLGLQAATPEAWKGDSLLPVMAGREPRPLVFIEVFQAGGSHQAYGVVRWPWKLIHTVPDNLFELYDLAQDSGERRNVFDPSPDVATPLLEILDIHRAADW